jgi:O-antigen/teichoic acid export membrane protein
MDQGLHDRIARGTAWAFASSWARLAISLAAFMLIARLIGPERYGLNTAAGAFAVLGQALVGPAAGEVIVQRQTLPAEAQTAYFRLLLMVGILIAAVIAAIGPLAAKISGHPELAALMAVYALTVPLTALQTVPEACLSQGLQFRPQALASGAGVIAGSVVGVALAYAGAELWALAGLQLTQSGVQAALLWRGARWRPATIADRSALPGLLRYSGSSIGTRLINELDSQLPKVFIGAALGSSALGHYALARRIFDLLKDVLIVPLNTVALPSLAKARVRGEDVSQLFGSALRISTFVANPAFLGLAAIAPLLVPGLFGRGWEPAIAALQLLALLGLRSAVNSFNGAALRSYGRPLAQLSIAAAGLALLCLLLPIATRYGLLAAIAAIVLRAYALWPVSALMVERLGVFPALRQFTVGLRSLAASLLMMACVWSLSLWLEPALPAWVLLPVCIAGGALLYFGASFALAPAEFREGLQTLSRLLRRKPVARTAAAA